VDFVLAVQETRVVDARENEANDRDEIKRRSYHIRVVKKLSLNVCDKSAHQTLAGGKNTALWR